MAFRITSPAFADGAPIPRRHTCDGDNLSPALTWHGAPDLARSFVLIVDDPDARTGTFTHWILFDLPAGTTELGESRPGGTIGRAAVTSAGRADYMGPCPPPGDAPHRYRFTLHALDVPSLGLKDPATRTQVDAKLDTHVLATARLVGTYQRQAHQGASTGL